jgi:hypothetical protein
MTLAQIVSVALALIGGAMIVGLKDRPAAKASLVSPAKAA